MLTALSTGKVPSRLGASDFAPDFISWMARTNRKIAATKYTTFSPTRTQGGRGARAATGWAGLGPAGSDWTVSVERSRRLRPQAEVHQVHA